MYDNYRVYLEIQESVSAPDIQIPWSHKYSEVGTTIRSMSCVTTMLALFWFASLLMCWHFLCIVCTEVSIATWNDVCICASVLIIGSV